MTAELKKILDEFSYSKSHNIYSSNKSTEGYWSNLTVKENEQMIQDLDSLGSVNTILKHRPILHDIIFSDERAAGLELLDIKGNEVCVDYGCMWGALTVPLAKRCKSIISIDQTYASLRLLSKRIEEKKLKNVILLQHDIKKLPPNKFNTDIAIINGVLEWIPNTGTFELTTLFGKRKKQLSTANPYKNHLDFLKIVHSNQSEKGKLYLAIENRFDIKQFLGDKDPHVHLWFTSFCPRFISNIISKICLGRPYINWLHSFSGLKKLLLKSGYSSVKLYACFPHYHKPQSIIPYDNNFHKNFDLSSFNLVPRKRFLSRARCFVLRKVYTLIFKYLRLKQFSPSIIAIAHK